MYLYENLSIMVLPYFSKKQNKEDLKAHLDKWFKKYPKSINAAKDYSKAETIIRMACKAQGFTCIKVTKEGCNKFAMVFVDKTLISTPEELYNSLVEQKIIQSLRDNPLVFG